MSGETIGGKRTLLEKEGKKGSSEQREDLVEWKKRTGINKENKGKTKISWAGGRVKKVNQDAMWAGCSNHTDSGVEQN